MTTSNISEAPQVPYLSYQSRYQLIRITYSRHNPTRDKLPNSDWLPLDNALLSLLGDTLRGRPRLGRKADPGTPHLGDQLRLS